MTYDAEGVIKRKREDRRGERSEEKEEPRTRRSRGEETTITQEPEEERENTVAGEQSTKGEPAITQELKGEEDTASKVIETEGKTRKSGRLEDKKNQWATPNPTEDHGGPPTCRPHPWRDVALPEPVIGQFQGESLLEAVAGASSSLEINRNFGAISPVRVRFW
ncbi:hypothetical protein NDU88_007085 [Pleurodeles waltl]|uniref:Uncharacterized protein n=1 Tax=Pleurodeles waltl TaxID=8319 RepID=A0AAV7RTS0_PLEWA|nr:hypothetical protein NDU88_007085 [Pleurodeles waltl]